MLGFGGISKERGAKMWERVKEDDQCAWCGYPMYAGNPGDWVYWVDNNPFCSESCASKQEANDYSVVMEEFEEC
jgi:hypothetical protein